MSLTLNSDLYAQAKQLGIDVSQVAEEALIQQVARRKAEQVKAEQGKAEMAEIEQDLQAANTYMAKHGSFSDMVRQYDRDQGED